MTGTATPYGATVNVADWPFPECDPTVKTWQWFSNDYVNADLDTLGSAFIGEAELTATMTSVTPCAPIDSGAIALTVGTPFCTLVCLGSSGSINCSLSGSFLRVGTEMNMLVGGSCSINGRPSVSVQLDGQWHAFFGPAQPVPFCSCGYYAPYSGPYDFASISVSG